MLYPLYCIKLNLGIGSKTYNCPKQKWNLNNEGRIALKIFKNEDHSEKSVTKKEQSSLQNLKSHSFYGGVVSFLRGVHWSVVFTLIHLKNTWKEVDWYFFDYVTFIQCLEIGVIRFRFTVVRYWLKIKTHAEFGKTRLCHVSPQHWPVHAWL